MTDEFAHLLPRYARERNLKNVIDGYEADDPDSSVPYSAHPTGSYHPRYAVVTESERGHGYSVNLAAMWDDAALVAAANINEGWQPVCVFDLDELAGDEPRPTEGDVVTIDDSWSHWRQEIHADRRYYVVGTETDTFDGEAYEKLYLSARRDADWLGGDYAHKLDEQHVTVVERAEPDERMPVRYKLAKVQTIVVFNSTPEPA